MNEINKAISTAQRRLAIGQFFSILTWAAFVSLLVATVGIALPKVSHFEFLQSQDQKDAWIYSWVLTAIVIGFVTSAVLTWRKLKSRLEVATEVDRRFHLKERLSSAISLPPENSNDDVSQALIQDATRRAETIEVAEKFELRPRLSSLLPLIPMAIITILLLLVPDAQKPVVAASPEKLDKEKARLKVEAFKKKLEQTRKQIDAKGLKDASEDVKAIAKKLDKLNSSNFENKKEALVKINDIKREIEKRQKSIGDSKKFRENLNKLKEAGKGEAKKVSEALADGKFADADKAIKQLAKKLKEGKLSKAEAKKIAKDLKALAEQMKKAAEQRQQKMDELQKQIDKAVQEGNLDQAAKLQQKLDQQKQNDNQQNQMNKLAQQLKKAAEQMKQGEGGDPQKLQEALEKAAEELEKMGGDLQDLEQQMQDMEALEDLEDMMDELKQPGDGEGDQGGQGQGNGRGDGEEGNAKGEGNGKGKGLGERGFEEDETSGFKTGVRGKVGKGEKVVTGNADGNNISGRSSSEVAELIRKTEARTTDPTENQKLSKRHREHAEQYFRSLRDQ